MAKKNKPEGAMKNKSEKAMENKPEKAVETMDFESQLKRLQDIVRQLEAGDLPLEKGVELFKEGTELAKACRKRLDEAKTEVEILAEGVFREFDAAGGADEGDDDA